MRIGIIGAGAIGLHLAGQLHMAGINVNLICRSEAQAKELTTQGLMYQRHNGESKRLFIPATTGQSSGMFELLILAVKQIHISSTISLLKKLKHEQTVFLCFQNGLGHDEVLRGEFPTVPIFFAVTTDGALKTSVTSVWHTGLGKTWIGSANNGEMPNSKLLGNHLVDLFNRTELSVQEEKNIFSRIWRKLLVNSCINPLTAIHKVPNGRLVESTSSLTVMEQIFKEGQMVAVSQGIEIEDLFFNEIIQVCRDTYHNKSSMLQDVEMGQATEIEYINGAIKRIADSLGLEVPINAVLISMVHATQELAAKNS